MQIRIEDLTVRRGGRLLFRHLSCLCPAGACLKLTGPNGIGKTSLLRIIAGFLPPESGNIIFKDGDVSITEPEMRAPHCGWLGASDAIKPNLPVADQLFLYARLSAAGDDAVQDALNRCGLRPCGPLAGRTLSAGQKRRFSLARLMLSRRPLWLMDEPLAMLDPEGRKLILKAMAEHCACGGIIVTAGQDEIPLAGPHITFGGPA